MKGPAFAEGMVTTSLERVRMRDGTTGGDQIERMNRRVRAFVAERPVASVLLALTAGYLVGRIISRLS